MKYLILFLLFLLPMAVKANCEDMSQVALKFSNSYIRFLQAPNKWSGQWPKDWIQSNKYLTTDFKLSYKAIMNKAFKNDPDFGLGFDPILDAQDYPDNGFVVTECNAIERRVSLQGNQWDSFKITVQLKIVNSQWLVNQMGVVNNKSD